MNRYIRSYIKTKEKIFIYIVVVVNYEWDNIETHAFEIECELKLIPRKIEAKVFYRENGKTNPYTKGRVQVCYPGIDGQDCKEMKLVKNNTIYSADIRCFPEPSPILLATGTKFLHDGEQKILSDNPQLEMFFKLPVLYVMMNPNERFQLFLKDRGGDGTIWKDFVKKYYHFVYMLISGNWRSNWSNAYVYALYGGLEFPSKPLIDRDTTGTHWDDKEIAIFIENNMDLKNRVIRPDEVVKTTSSLLDGFSFKPSDNIRDIRGVLVYFLGAPVDFPDDNMANSLDELLKKHRMAALIVQLKSAKDYPERWESSDKYTHLKFVEMELNAEWNNQFFGKVFDDSAEMLSVLLRNFQ